MMIRYKGHQLIPIDLLPRVRELADEIIMAQRKEIAEMKALIADLEARK